MSGKHLNSGMNSRIISIAGVAVMLFATLGLNACSGPDADASNNSNAAVSESSQTAASTSEDTAAGEEAATAKTNARPNILLVIVDDMGYSDLGVYGGEDIATPNLDELASEGVMFTSFYSAPTCSPTRSMLMSGTDNHLAGLGNMFEERAPNQADKPGYEGYLNERVAWMAELLRDAGYHTYMTGKWHLGLTEDTSPAARGFDRSFALLQGGAGHFDRLPIIGPNPALYNEDGKALEQLPQDYYTTAFFTDRMIEYIDSQTDDDKPFLAYLSYSAPHWPLQAPRESIAKYAGVYDEGYDVLHDKRLAKMIELGIVPEGVKADPRMPGEPAWSELNDEQRAIEARKMEIFAAMVDDVDSHFARLITHLKAIGEYDNTFIFFMSDNGAEGHHLDFDWDELAEFVEQCCDNSYENMGNANSYIWYGPNWGRAGSQPWRMFKGFTTEGGIRVPAFAHYPKRFKGERRFEGVATVMDVLPTLLDLAGVPDPGREYNGRQIEPIRGQSMMPMLSGDTERVHAPDANFGWELFGKRAVRSGPWKLVWTTKPFGKDQWELFNLDTDPGEQNDLSAVHPDVRMRLFTLWQAYQQDNNVVLPSRASAY